MIRTGAKALEMMCFVGLGYDRPTEAESQYLRSESPERLRSISCGALQYWVGDADCRIRRLLRAAGGLRARSTGTHDHVARLSSEPAIGVEQMKTKWGSCTAEDRRILAESGSGEEAAAVLGMHHRP